MITLWLWCKALTLFHLPDLLLLVSIALIPPHECEAGFSVPSRVYNTASTIRTPEQCDFHLLPFFAQLWANGLPSYDRTIQLLFCRELTSSSGNSQKRTTAFQWSCELSRTTFFGAKQLCESLECWFSSLKGSDTPTLQHMACKKTLPVS